ncbi:unnamed protein product [Sphagnum troendelagicum]|uniref:AB hydrolase-1 domain-containing protein n=1 Tax=Sphagnum troendelagicum TaxID=128251 RepID=A0ABP0TE45_9BRYO
MQNMSCGGGGGFAFRSCCCSCWTAPCLLPPSSPRLLLLCPPPHRYSSSAAIDTASTTAAWSLARQTSSLLLPPQLLRQQSLLNKLVVGSKSCVVPESQKLGHWNWRWSAVRPFASLGRRAEEDQQQQEKMKTLKEMEKEAAGRMPPAADEEANNKTELGKPEECTADELHYVAVPGTPWRLSLWRYLPSAKGPKRNHPVLMLSGIGTNAIGFDLDPSVSLARYLSGAGFDTWILEVRGAGLSKREVKKEDKPMGAQETTEIMTEVQKSADTQGITSVKKVNDESVLGQETKAMEKVDDSLQDEETMATRLTNSVLQLSQKLSGLVSEGQSQLLSAKFIEKISSLLEDGVLTGRLGELRERLTSVVEGRYNNSTLSTQIADLTKRVTLLLEEGQRSVSPRVSNLQETLNATIGEFQEILDLIAEYDWDFDNYLTEDVPAAMDYVLSHSASRDGKVLGVGHSMGGILLYAMLATHGSLHAVAAKQAALAGAVTVASSLDYGVSNTSLKHLLPLADPAVLFNVPVIPLGALMTALHPLVSRPPYALSYLGYQVSARQMMDPALFKKLVLNNFCTVPVKLLLQLATVFQPGGLRDRSGTVIYKDGLKSCKVPVLAIAGDLDLICPPAAVLDTMKAFPGATVTYKLFGGKHERHYGHYDLLCARTAKREVFPIVEDFLEKCDGSKSRFVN